MIKKLQIVLFLLFVIFAQHQAKSQITLENLLNELPAHDAVELELINQAFLQFGAEGILKICSLLESPEEGTKVRFALSGLAKQVSRPGFETSRLMFTKSILTALDKTLNYDVKAYLINQLQLVAKDEVVEKLGELLSDEKLYQYATLALISVGSKKANEQLLNELIKENPVNQSTLMKALGELRSEEAVPILQKFGKSQNINIRNSALFALANIGEKSSQELLQTAVQEETGFNQSEIYSYLYLFAQRLYEQGEENLCREICETVLKSNADENIKSAALSALVRAEGPAALDNLLAAFDSGEEKLQGTAIQLSSQIPGEEATAKWLRKIQNEPVENQVKIVEMLGERDDKTALPQIYRLFNSDHKIIVVSAISAAVKLDKEKAILPLLQCLNTTEDSEIIQKVEEILLQFETEDFLDPLIKNLSKVSCSAQVALLEILDQRRPTISSGAVFKLASSEESKVRIAAVKVLANMAIDKDLAKLVSLLLRSEKQMEQSNLQKTIAALVNSSENSEKLTKDLIGNYQKAKIDQKLLFLQTLGKVENKLAVAVLVKAAENDTALKVEAVRILSNSRNQDVLPHLKNIIDSSASENHQILAIRGMVRLISTSDYPDKKKIRLLYELIRKANRLEGKKLALAALGEIKTRESLNIVRKYLSNADLQTEAALAAVRISSSGNHQENGITSSEVALVLANYSGDPNLQALIENQFSDFSGLNQPPKGFEQLFNGSDLTGWKGLVENPLKRAQMSKEELAAAQEKADQDMIEHWSVEDGILVFDGKGHSLSTAKDYENFEMLVDWKIQKGGDSGIYLRGSPQVQIWDPAQWPEGSGGLYNNQKGARSPLEVADNPIGEWNTFRIKMIEDRVTVFLNDVLVDDDVVMENYWERDKPIYSMGQIELQAHSTPLYFRNIFIRELPRQKQLYSGDLFNGIDLTGWKIINGKPGSWKVKDKILFTGGDGGGWISTEKEFANFILELEFRVPEGGNSGVMIRAPHFGNPSYTGMEIQVLDDYGDQSANLKPWQYTGSVYAVEPAANRASKTAGQWQKMKIRCNGPIIQVELDGMQVVNTNLILHMDKEAEHPGIKNRKGHIGFQNHSTKIEYRNIKITELE